MGNKINEKSKRCYNCNKPNLEKSVYLREQNMINQQITIYFRSFESSGNVVKNRIARLGIATLIKNHQRSNLFEVFFFNSLLLGHIILELGGSHAHVGVIFPLQILLYERERIAANANVCASMLGRAELREQSGHLVKRPSTNSLLVARARQVVANFLLVIPQQAMQRQHIGIANKAHVVGVLGRKVLRVDVQFARRNVDHKIGGQLQIGAKKIVEILHVHLFGKDQIVGYVLQNFAHESEAALHLRRRLHVHNAVLVRADQHRVYEAQKNDRADRLKARLRKPVRYHLVQTMAHYSHVNGKYLVRIYDGINDTLGELKQIVSILVHTLIGLDARRIHFVRLENVVRQEQIHEQRLKQLDQVVGAVYFEAEGHDFGG
ncbi:hypothetical protein BpHYR1_050689 [Brachionus plicatilis]|uniref:Uncharacterized protein n=1 Tax=Brachionus plicatilis TaxID=10195 RepID=A0A3M7RB76_BRAPC|nr:hypothetical protein BpHYR1_050689 [Brachionus plicatilis]